MLGRLARLFNKEHILEVLRNPRSSLQEALLLAGIVVVLVLIVLAVLAVIFARPTPKMQRVKKRRRGPLIALGVVLGFSVLVMLMVGSFSVGAAQSKSCNLCHQMKKSYASWKSSSHSQVACIDCHRKPGLTGFVIYELERASDVRAYLARTSGTLGSGEVASESCLQCHAERISRTFVARSVRVRHRDFLAAGQRCTLCHNAAGHGQEVASPKYPSMSRCTQCHDGKKVSADCLLCHAKDVGTVASRQGEKALYPTVEIGRPTTCRGCHPVDKCNQCHGLELPHPPGWTDPPVLHAKEAAFEKKEACVKCHSTVYCNKCHNFPGHDPTTWKHDHAAATSQEGCKSCHKAAGVTDFCGLCHGG